MWTVGDGVIDVCVEVSSAVSIFAGSASAVITATRCGVSEVTLCIVVDALYANTPTVRLLRELQMDFILSVKPSKGRQSVFAYDAISGCTEAKWDKASATQAQQERVPKDQGTLEYRILGARSLNAANLDD